jgi:hypothetical protein
MGPGTAKGEAKVHRRRGSSAGPPRPKVSRRLGPEGDQTGLSAMGKSRLASRLASGTECERSVGCRTAIFSLERRLWAGGTPHAAPTSSSSSRPKSRDPAGVADGAVADNGRCAISGGGRVPGQARDDGGWVGGAGRRGVSAPGRKPAVCIAHQNPPCPGASRPGAPASAFCTTAISVTALNYAHCRRCSRRDCWCGPGMT